VSYFRPQKVRKIGPRAIYSFSDSTLRLSQNAGQVIGFERLSLKCLSVRVRLVVYVHELADGRMRIFLRGGKRLVS
jgi:hypothetical protein